MKTLVICKSRIEMHASFYAESPKFAGEAGGQISGNIGPNKAHVQTTTQRVEWITEKDFTAEGMSGYKCDKVVVQQGVNVDPLLVMIVEQGNVRKAQVTSPK